MRLVALLTLLALSATATAQVYKWKDASGKVHYSDRPAEDKTIQSKTFRPTMDYSDDVEKAAENRAAKKENSAKQAKEAGEKAAQAEKERENEAIRQQNCATAKRNLAGLESGQIRYRISASGEREALDGDVRESELSAARQAVETNCAPKK